MKSDRGRGHSSVGKMLTMHALGAEFNRKKSAGDVQTGRSLGTTASRPSLVR